MIERAVRRLRALGRPSVVAPTAPPRPLGADPSAFDEVLATLWNGVSPYDGFDPAGFSADPQGWNSHHSYLSDTLATTEPRVVVEVGVWKGGSTVHMAQTLRDRGVDGVVIAVDTWLGAWDHWEQPQWFADLRMRNGFPQLYYTFLTNVIASGTTDRVVPLPLDSANAAIVLGRKGVVPDVVHIDAGHDYDAVRADLRLWWPLLAPGGVLIADDYDPEGKVWPSVRDAVDDFLRETPHEGFEHEAYKCRFRKPHP